MALEALGFQCLGLRVQGLLRSSGVGFWVGNLQFPSSLNIALNP